MDVQIKHYEQKLAFEMDPSDLFDALNKGEKVIALDARKAFGFDRFWFHSYPTCPANNLRTRVEQALSWPVARCGSNI